MNFIKNFGDGGGYRMILERMSQFSKSMDMPLLFSFIDIMTFPFYLYHRAFVKETIKPFVEASMYLIPKLLEEEAKNTNKNNLDLAVKRLELLMMRVYTPRKKNEMMVKLRVSIGVSLLKSKQLESRIQGIRIIAESCKAAKTSFYAQVHYSQLTNNETEVLNSILQVPQVIEEIFGKYSHIQLIQRSTEILKFFLLHGNLKKAELDVIWNCCTRDEQSKVEIFKVISDSLAFLSKEFIGFIVEKLSLTPPGLLKDKEVNLLGELAVRNTLLSNSVQIQVFDLMWDISLKSKEYSSILPDMREKILAKFCDLITTPTNVPLETMKDYFSRAYVMISQVFLIYLFF